MSLFGQVNEIYATYFGISPPSRACIAASLPTGIRVRLDALAHDKGDGRAGTREALHVQSLSYWAPANIGPYSQSIVCDQRVFISGQIGLIPKDLVRPAPESLTTEMGLACQNVDRVLDVLRDNSGGGWKGWYQASIYWLYRPGDLPRVRGMHERYEQVSF